MENELKEKQLRQEITKIVFKSRSMEETIENLLYWHVKICTQSDAADGYNRSYWKQMLGKLENERV